MNEVKTKARLIDVAQAAGVSRQTAGAVLLGGRTNTRAGKETAIKILEAAKRLNYQPNQAARQLKGLASGVIGILCETIREPTHSLIATSLMQILTERGYSPALACFTETGKSLDKQVAEMVQRGVDGLLVVDERFNRRPKSLQYLLELCPRTVLYACGYNAGGWGTHFVDVDRTLAMRLAVRHLVERGCQRIGLFTSGDNFDLEEVAQRRGGYRQELKAHAIAMDERLIFTSDWARWVNGDLAPEARDLVSQMVERLVVEQQADALLLGVIPPPLAIGVLLELRDRGLRVPEDVAVMTTRDDPVYRFIRPMLSSIEVHHDAVALPMVQMLEQMLEHDAHLRLRGNVLVEPELIKREST